MSLFLHHPNITGEASDPNFTGWLDLLSLRWGSQRKITSNTSTQGDRESANAEITDLTLFRRMDKATPSLFLEACCGRGNTIELALTKTGTGAGAQAYMRYTIENAVISHYSVQASAQKAARPVEKITISFTSLQLQYTPFDENGLPEANIAVGFDTATNALL